MARYVLRKKGTGDNYIAKPEVGISFPVDLRVTPRWKNEINKKIRTGKGAVVDGRIFTTKPKKTLKVMKVFNL